MRYFPIFTDLRGKTVIVAGGGEVTLSKLRVLLKTEADIKVYASKLSNEILQWAEEGKLKAYPRALETDDLASASLLYSTYYSEKQNAKIALMGRRAGVLTNVVDSASLSDFISPAIVDRDPVVVAIGTEGAAPVLARKIKADIEERLAPNIGLMARVAKAFRHAVEVLPFGRLRRDFWSNYYAQNIHNEDEARSALENALRAASAETECIGRVSFVGAGPGDPELLTLKARKSLDKADVVIHDRLVSANILELARREAKIINVGKKGYGTSWLQDDINKLIVEHAKKGDLVVRLKGGDACVFGRLDEEIEVVKAAGIEFDVVPGITSASAAAARLGQSLTRRGRNSEIRLLSAREVEGFAEHEWRALAKEGATAALYMGAKAARFIQGRLLMYGASPLIPITAVENISLAGERILKSNVGNIAEDLERFDPAGPVIMLLGISPKTQSVKELDNAASI